MAQHKSYSPAAASYAQALIELAPDDASAEAMSEELASLASALNADGTVRSFFIDPSITPGERWRTIQKTLGSRSSRIFLNFLGVLNEKGRFGLLSEIGHAYRDMLDRKQNRVRVEVTVAQRLDGAELSMVQERVSKALGKTAIIEQKIDDSIIGGLVLKVQDRVIDGSVKAQLEAMRKQLLGARPVAAQ